jgi:hypothetical protein
MLVGWKEWRPNLRQSAKSADQNLPSVPEISKTRVPFRRHCQDCEPQARPDAAIVLGGAASTPSTIAALRSQ